MVMEEDEGCSLAYYFLLGGSLNACMHGVTKPVIGIGNIRCKTELG